MSNPETPTSQDVPSSPHTSGWKWVAGVAITVAVLAVVAAAFAIARDDDNGGASSQALDSERVAATQTACQQWLEDYSSSTGAAPYRGWCNDMTGWMYDQMANGSMTGPMMWGNPQAMIDACRQWRTTAPTGETTGTTTPSANTWCDQMVGWMSQHMGNWDDWEDWNDHMNDGHWNGMMNQ